MENKPEQAPIFKIEPPREGDEVLIGPVHLQAWLESYKDLTPEITEALIKGTIGHVAMDEGNKHRKKIFTEAQKNPDKILYRVVRNQQDKIVGFMHGGKNDKYNNLNGLFLLDEAKGSGTGGRLMEEFLGWGDKTKASHLKVLERNNHAIGFYSKYGFKKTDKPAEDVRKGFPAIEMIRPSEVSREI